MAGDGVRRPLGGAHMKPAQGVAEVEPKPFLEDKSREVKLAGGATMVIAGRAWGRQERLLEVAVKQAADLAARATATDIIEQIRAMVCDEATLADAATRGSVRESNHERNGLALERAAKAIELCWPTTEGGDHVGSGWRAAGGGAGGDAEAGAGSAADAPRG
jgi:hypothetical protein